VSKKASRSESRRVRVQGATLPAGETGLVGTGEGRRTGALGLAGECEGSRRDGGVEDEAEAEGWFIAAREESCGMPPAVVVVVLVGGGRAAGSWSEGVLVLEAQQPWWWSVRYGAHFAQCRWQGE
jgi:hypothetical protein